MTTPAPLRVSSRTCFVPVEGLELKESERIIAERGAAEHWRPAMQRHAQRLLMSWHGDVAVVGIAGKGETVRSLWFIPRDGDGTLGKCGWPVQKIDIQSRVLADLRGELQALALNTAVETANEGDRSSLAPIRLRAVETKVYRLLQAADTPLQKARLQLAYGSLQTIIGKSEGGTERLERAIVTFKDALKHIPREEAMAWATARCHLGVALMGLSDSAGSDPAEEALANFRAALEVCTFDDHPVEWATLQQNIGQALSSLGGSRRSDELLARAYDAHLAALRVRNQRDAPLAWATTQLCLGTQLLAAREVD